MGNTDIIDGNFFKEIKKPLSFYILRHGETMSNSEGRIQGRSECFLNDKGKSQAAMLAEYLKDKGIKRIFHSPLARAAETASIISRELGYPEAEEESLLIELDTGIFTGKTFHEIGLEYPDLLKEFMYKSWDVVPAAESALLLYSRACAAWTKLKQAAMESGGSVAAVSHGGFIQWLFRSSFGHKSWMPLITTGNCSVFELFVRGGDGINPVYMQWKEINMLPAKGCSTASMTL